MELPAYRPPSEAESLLIRVTRNCPWNKCAFCGMYKGKTFSRRPAEEVREDIRQARALRDLVQSLWRQAGAGEEGLRRVRMILARERGLDIAYLPWLYRENITAFLADSDSLTLRGAELAPLVRFLRETFPEVTRVTSYARARSILRRTPEELQRLREAGLDRLHVGLESGDDEVLARIRKGATAEQMVEAGRKAKAAGFSVSFYVLLGVGGPELSPQHAAGTARVLNAVDPDFIRLRTLRLEPHTPLAARHAAGEFRLCTPEEILREERALLEALQVHSQFLSDHVSNYLSLNGRLPEDKPRLLAELDAVLARLAADPEGARRLLQPEHLRTL